MKEMRRYYFIAGLPRSGSTLLSSILNQNPRFYSGPSSPVLTTMMSIEQTLANDELFQAYPKPHQANELIANVINHFYSDVKKPVIFDKNRFWVNRIHYISGYFGCEPRILVPVRDTAEILSSFISMHRRNPREINGKINFIDEMLIKSNIPLTDDNRCQFIAGPGGILGQSYSGIRQALLEGYQKQLHFIEYNDLVMNTAETLRKIYRFLDEEYYTHNFSNIKNLHHERDGEIYGFVDMHDVRPSINKQSIDPNEILSEKILAQCKNSEFWRDMLEDI